MLLQLLVKGTASHTARPTTRLSVITVWVSTLVWAGGGDYWGCPFVYGLCWLLCSWFNCVLLDFKVRFRRWYPVHKLHELLYFEWTVQHQLLLLCVYRDFHRVITSCFGLRLAR